MKTIKKVKGLSLNFIWKKRLKLRADGDELCAEGDKLHAKGNKLHAKGNKLYAEGNKLYAESNKLWAEAILKLYGDINIDWNGHNECKLETGEIFKGK